MNHTHTFGVTCADFEYAYRYCRATCWLDFRSQVFEKIQTPHAIFSHRKPDHGSVDCCSSWNQMTSGCLRRPYTDTTTSYRNTEGGVKFFTDHSWNDIIQSPKSRQLQIISLRNYTEGGLKFSHIIPWMIRRVPNLASYRFPNPYAAPDFPSSLQFVQYSWLMSKPTARHPPLTHSYKYFSSNRVWTDSWSGESQITHKSHLHQFAHYKSNTMTSVLQVCVVLFKTLNPKP